jgi:peptidoglycan/xylan/chitin deacetylase (PgdA/CDA1 family)
MSRAAILTYHPLHIIENTYAGNDLLALESDLATLDRLGIQVRSLDQLFTAPGSDRLLNDLRMPVVSITFDDGSVFDFVDRPHPTCGPQRSAATILAQNAARRPNLAASLPLATTFVIASPEARAELDRRDYFGGGYWGDEWWREAAASGVLGVESHSWDHNHPSLERTLQRDNVRGTFENIETVAEAEGEIARSLAYIERRAGVAPRFFAYPWGEANAFLVDEYLPHRGASLGLKAAVSSAPLASGFVTEDSGRWLVPRFVCGHDWKSPEGLEALLRGLPGS